MHIRKKHTHTAMHTHTSVSSCRQCETWQQINHHGPCQASHCLIVKERSIYTCIHCQANHCGIGFYFFNIYWSINIKHSFLFSLKSHNDNKHSWSGPCLHVWAKEKNKKKDCTFQKREKWKVAADGMEKSILSFFLTFSKSKSVP